MFLPLILKKKLNQLSKIIKPAQTWVIFIGKSAMAKKNFTQVNRAQNTQQIQK